MTRHYACQVSITELRRGPSTCGVLAHFAPGNRSALLAIFGVNAVAYGRLSYKAVVFEGYGDQGTLQTVAQSESCFHKDAASNPRPHSAYATNSNTGLHAAHCSTLFRGFEMVWDMIKASAPSLFKIPLTACGCGCCGDMEVVGHVCRLVCGRVKGML